MNIQFDQDKLVSFCQKNHIGKLAFFGSVLGPDFNSDSDIDILVEFEPDHTPGLFAMARMQRELSALFMGRRIDLRTPEDLSRYFRKEVVSKADVRYAA